MVLKLVLDVILDLKFEVIDVGQFRIGTDFNGPGDSGGFVLGTEADPVLATAQGIATPKNLAMQVGARYPLGR